MRVAGTLLNVLQLPQVKVRNLMASWTLGTADMPPYIPSQYLVPYNYLGGARTVLFVQTKPGHCLTGR